MFTIKIKVVIILFVIQYTIYFTLGYFIFRCCQPCCLKSTEKVKRERRKKEEAIIEIVLLSRGVVDQSEVGIPTFLNHWFHDH